MSAAIVPWLVMPGFLLVFAGMWFGITSLLMALAGWKRLEQRYPDSGEPALASLRARFAVMGAGVKFQRALHLSACRTGLRIEIGRLLGHGRKPFLVPWSEIAATPGRNAFAQPIRIARPIRLGFGTPESGRLTLDEQEWKTLRRP